MMSRWAKIAAIAAGSFLITMMLNGPAMRLLTAPLIRSGAQLYFSRLQEAFVMKAKFTLALTCFIGVIMLGVFGPKSAKIWSRIALVVVPAVLGLAIGVTWRIGRVDAALGLTPALPGNHPPVMIPAETVGLHWVFAPGIALAAIGLTILTIREHRQSNLPPQPDAPTSGA